MHFLGRYQLGDFLPLTVQCRNSSKAPVDPTSAVTLTIYDSSLVTVLNSEPLPPKDIANLTGIFEAEMQIDSLFSEGIYFAMHEWSGGGKALDTFEVIAGGNSTGGYVGIHFYERPGVEFIVGQTDGSTLEARRNPKV